MEDKKKEGGGKTDSERKDERHRERTNGRNMGEGRRAGSSGSCGLPVTDSASDNAFIMGKGEQRKGLIHRRVRES